MESHSTRQLQQFIADNHLASQREIILFDAVITFYRNNKLVTAVSEIQVITLPKEMVLYVLEFVKDVYHESEIYSTVSYFFNCRGKNILEIRDDHNKDLLLFTVTIAEKNEAASQS
jgi:hypothetical protein